MIEAGQVGARFTLVNEASPVIKKLMEDFTALQGTIDRFMSSLDAMRLPPGLGVGIGKLDESLGTVATSAETMSAKVAAGFGDMDSAISATQRKLAALRSEMRGVGNAGSEIGGSRTIGPNGQVLRTGNVGPREHGGSAMHFGAHERFGPLAVRAVGNSSIPMAAGFAALFAGYEGEKQAFDVAQADNNLRIAGATPEAVARANAAAIAMSRFGMSQVEGLNAIRTAGVPLNTGGTTDSGIDAAISVLPTIGKFDQLARSLKGEDGGDATKQVFELLKSAELRNKLTPEETSKFIEDYAQVYAGSGGKVDPKTFYQGLKYSKSAGIGFGDEFVKYTLPGIETEEGGSTAGTMLMTTASALLGRRLKKPALAELQGMGIYSADETLKDADLEVRNPFQWMQQNLMPAMVKAGFTTKEQQIEFVERIFNRNAAETGVLLGINPGNVERTAAAIKRSDSLADATSKIDASDPYASLSKAFASLKDLGAALGGPTIPGIVASLNAFADALGFATHSITSVHKKPDGTPEYLDSTHDGTWDAVRGLFSSPASAKPLMSGSRSIVGRDPRSPSSGPYAYTPSSAPIVNVAPPHVTSSANVDVKVYLDGNILGTSTASDTRVSDSSYDHDGRMGFAGPDVRN
jgi:hypothetical protein